MAFLNGLKNDRICLIALVLLILCSETGFASRVFDQRNIKVAFLYQLPNFIDLAEQPVRIGKRLINVCIVGRNPFQKTQEFLSREMEGDHQLRFIEKRRSDSFGRCHIVFISETEQANFQFILKKLRDRKILTVSSIRKFAKSGGMIGFTEFNGNIRLEINTQALAQAKFMVDQHLLEVALHVY